MKPMSSGLRVRRFHVRVAVWLLTHLARRNEPLAGDLLEQFRIKRSAWWLWSQLLLAVVLGSFRQSRTPAALNLTQLDPVVLEWLVDRKLAPRRVTMGSPGEGVGGLGMMLIGFLLSTVVPDVWYFVMGGIVCGVGLGVTLAYRRRLKPMATDGQIHTGQLKDLFA